MMHENVIKELQKAIKEAMDKFETPMALEIKVQMFMNPDANLMTVRDSETGKLLYTVRV